VSVVAATDEQPPDDAPTAAFGRYLRSQRELAQLSLRQVAEVARISNPYLSQIERGLHQPSITVVTALAKALNLSADVLLAQAAGLGGTDEADEPGANRTEEAIRADTQLSPSQKRTLLEVYRSFVDSGA
jgi:transcriptional regulator with XRE-family HTH domain